MKVILEIINLKGKELNIGIKNHGKEIDMKVIGEMIKEKVKVFIIIIVVIDMKVILKMITLKEKEYFILIMVIGEWVII